MQHWFSNPLAFLLLGVLPGLALLGWLARRRRRLALMLLGNLSGFGSARIGRDALAAARGLCLSCGIALLLVGIAGPQWGREVVAVATGRDLVVVLDMSRSMAAEQPSRFQRAKAAVEELSREAQRRGGHRLGLVVFAGGAQVVCPLTHDYDHFREALKRLDVNDPPEELRPEGSGSGTRIGAGLREAAVTAHDERYRGYQDILLMSDGDDPAHDEEWRTGVNAARQRSIPVHVIGVGDPENASSIPTENGPLLHDDKMVTTRLEEEPLREIARLTGGTYVSARTRALPVGDVFRAIADRAGREELEGLEQPEGYRPRYAWFFAPALGLLALEMLLRRSSYTVSRS